jgi:hypothetical protein
MFASKLGFSPVLASLFLASCGANVAGEPNPVGFGGGLAMTTSTQALSSGGGSGSGGGGHLAMLSGTIVGPAVQLHRGVTGRVHHDKSYLGGASIVWASNGGVDEVSLRSGNEARLVVLANALIDAEI